MPTSGQVGSVRFAVDGNANYRTENAAPYSLCVDDDQVQDRALAVAGQLAAGSPSAIRWTKHALNNWYRDHSSIFDASWGLEFYGFGGPDAAEGLASHREKRAPEFRGPTSE